MNAELERQNVTTRPRLDGIESLRAVAASMIILYHMVLLPSPNIPLPSYLSIIKDKFGLGVPLFYALSGFVLAYGYLDKLGDRRSIINFYIRRYFRIAPLFYFMILVWMVASRVKWGRFPASFHDLMLNFLLLFGFVPGKHESIVWAGWSIGVEIIFYMIFPIVSALINSVKSGVLALAIAILVSSSFYTAGQSLDIGSYAYLNIITHMPTFLAGVLGCLIWRKMGFRQSKMLGVSLLVGATVAAACVVYVPVVFTVLSAVKGVRLDLYIWSIIFMMLILSISFWPNFVVVNKAMSHLGKISFSLYLLHPLVIIVLLDFYVLVRSRFGEGLANFIICAFMTLAFVAAAAFISYRFIEIPGMAYGKKITNKS